MPISSSPIVYLVDDDAHVVKAMTRLLSAEGYHVEGFESAEAFLDRHDPGLPGCAIIDLALPGLDGLGIQNRLCGDGSERPIIFLSGKGDIPSSVQAMKAGAVDFLTKPPDISALLAAVALALEKDFRLRRERAQRESVDLRLASLTPREHEVLDGVVAGRLNKQIAGALGTVEKTIKVHRGRMMAKMGVRTVAELVRLVPRKSD
jgi:FixJ family two-component response regulator